MRAPEPGSGHLGHTDVLPEVVVLVEGLDVVTAAGLKQSGTGAVDAEVDLHDPVKWGVDAVVLLSKLLVAEAKLVHEGGCHLLDLV